MNTENTLPSATELKAARKIALAVQDERWYQELVGEARKRLNDVIQSMRNGGPVQSLIRIRVCHDSDCDKNYPMARRLAKALKEAGYRAEAIDDLTAGEEDTPIITCVDIDLE
jgi:hypothetical protein